MEKRKIFDEGSKGPDTSQQELWVLVAKPRKNLLHVLQVHCPIKTSKQFSFYERFSTVL